MFILGDGKEMEVRGLFMFWSFEVVKLRFEFVTFGFKVYVRGYRVI